MIEKSIRRGAAAAALNLLLAVAAGAQSLDATINEIFAASTGWFVSFIFSNFPGTTFPWIVGCSWSAPRSSRSISASFRSAWRATRSRW